MFTLQVITKEKKQSLFIELGDTFKIISSDCEEEWIKNFKEQHPNIKLFIMGDKFTIPVLEDGDYIIYNSKNEIFKTL